MASIQAYLRDVCASYWPGRGEPQNVARPTTGRFNDSLFFRLDGADYIFRLAPREDQAFLFYERSMMAQEPQLHALVQARTDVPVAEVAVYDDSRQIAPRPYLIMERLPGGPFSQARNASPEAVYREVGRHLRAVHGITAEQYGYLGAHTAMTPADNWGDAFDVIWNKLLDDIVDVGGYSRDEAGLFRGLFQRDRAVFDRDVPASLLHMDVWAENILVDDAGRVTGLIDWDRALWGDPEIEFAVLDYCGVSIPAFWDGYGWPRGQTPKSERRRVYYHLYEMQKYIVIERGRRHNPALANRYKAEALRIADRMSG